MKSPGRDYKSKQQRRGRRAKRGRGRQTVVKAVLESEPAVDPQPDPQEKAEAVPSEPALPEPVYQQQLPLLTVPNMVSGMQAVAMDGELPSRSWDPAGELPQSCWPRGGSGGQCRAASRGLSAKGAHLINNDPTASPWHGPLPHKTWVAGKGWGDGGTVGTDSPLQSKGSDNKSTIVRTVTGMGLWTWSLITPCPKNTSVALPRAMLVQRDSSVKISSLWREDVVF